ncbi:MAG: hypothetical protein Q8R08_04675 [bacterium]|nr:hypothetical protein [bacterium]
MGLAETKIFSKNSKNLWILGLVIIIILAVFFALQYPKQKQLNELKQRIPEYFVDPSAKATVVTQTPQGTPPLLKSENLTEGLSYEVSKPYEQAANEFIITMKEQGWYAVFGSNKSPDKTIMRINNSKETLLCYIEPTDEQSTRVTIFPVNGK